MDQVVFRTLHTKVLIISNEKMEDIMKTVKWLEESELLIKGINETIKSKAKERKEGVVPIFLGTLAASMLGSGVIRAGEGTFRAGEDTISAGENFWYRPIL